MPFSGRSLLGICQARSPLPRLKPWFVAYHTLSVVSPNCGEKQCSRVIFSQRYHTSDIISHNIPISESIDDSSTSQTNESSGIRRDDFRSIDLKQLLERDDYTSGFPHEVAKMYNRILWGRIGNAWKRFHAVIKKGEEGIPSASIWHWYVIIGMIARDPSIPIENVRKMVEPMLSNYKTSAIYRSLKDPEEMNGEAGQQIVLYFTIMHNLRIRMTKEALHSVLQYFEEMMERRLFPSSRHVNVLCISLVHLGRSDQAMQTLYDWFGSSESTQKGQDEFGWGEARCMNCYTVAMMMYALLQEGQSLLAYEMFKLSIKDSTKLPITTITLNLLLWAAVQPYEAIGAISAREEREEYIAEPDFRDNMSKWQTQLIWDGIPSCIRARDIFQRRLFICYPELKSIENPLYQYRKGDANNVVWKVYSGISRWSNRLERLTAPLLRWRVSKGEEELEVVSTEALERKYYPDGSPSDMKWDSGAFDKYVQLLPFVGVYEEVPLTDYILVLAWMKHLELKPTEMILIRACWAINRLVPIATESFHNDSPAGPLHDYLVDWLGKDCIPHPHVIASYIKNRHASDW